MRPRLETLEPRRLLSVTPFSAPNSLLSSVVKRPTTVGVADLDGNGRKDLLLGTAEGLQLIRQTETGFGTPEAAFGPASGVVGDVNGDGVNDIVGLSHLSVAAYVNQGQGSFLEIEADDHRLLARGSSLTLIDIDRDGDLDASFIAHDLRHNFSGLGWSANDGNGRFGPFQGLIPLRDPFGGRRSDAVVADVDGDGDLDAVTVDERGRSPPRALIWHEQTSEGEYTAHRVVVPVELHSDSTVDLADADGDGRLELMVGTFRRSSAITVMGFNDDQQNFNQLTEYGMGIDASQLSFADVDLDGDLDVVRASGATLEWFARSPIGPFASNGVAITTSNDTINSFSVNDVDDDGDPDVVVVSEDFDLVALHRNNGSGSFSTEEVTRSALNEIREVVAVDFNGDSKTDLLTRGRHLSLIQAVDGTGSFDGGRDLDDRRISSMRVGDFDSDGDVDIAATDRSNLILLVNDGSGGVEQRSLGASGELVVDVDWDQDGDLDLVTTNDSNSEGGVLLSWYENLGQGAFAPNEQIADLNNHPIFFNFEPDFLFDREVRSLLPVTVMDSRMRLAVHVEQFSVDVSGIVLIGTDDNGSTVVSPAVVRFDSDDLRLRFAAADTDGDGYEEIISSIYGDGLQTRGWRDVSEDTIIQRPVEELDASIDRSQLRNVEYLARNPWTSIVTSRFDLGPRFYQHQFYPSEPLEIADVNGDGQLDIVGSRDADVFWIQNLTAQRDLNNDQIVNGQDVDLLSAAIQTGAIDAVFDINDDQQVNQRDLTVLVEFELNSRLGDVNLDGQFDSSDLVLLFQTGKFETNQLAQWTEGDFDGNGRFDSTDLVNALSVGYDRGFVDDD